MQLAPAPQKFIGVSLKMYFGHDETVQWCRRVAHLADGHPALESGLVELAVLPSFPGLIAGRDEFRGTPILVGAQDLFWADSGAFTGEVSGAYLQEIGCRYVEIGHAERRQIFGEDADMVAAKVAAAFRNSLTPIICIGESEHVSIADAAELCVAQLDDALGRAIDEGLIARVVAAYEPEWAIGAEEPASAAHIAGVCAVVGRWLDEARGLNGTRIIYGGSAGPGLLGSLGPEVDGLFLGRFAHDATSLVRILDETMELAR